MKNSTIGKDTGDSAGKDFFASHRLLAILLLCLLSFFPFSSNLNGEFIFDDTESIVNNPVVNGKIPIKEIFTRDFWGRNLVSNKSHKSFRPVTTATFWLNYQLSDAPFYFHLVNIGLHTTVTVILYLTVLQLEFKWPIPKSVAFPAAALFAVHPVHTEAIANITGRCELLCALLLLLAILFCLRSNSIVAPIILSLLSLFSKEQGIMTVPCLLLLSLPTHPSLLLILSFPPLLVLRLSLQSFTVPEFTIFDNPAAFVESPLFRVNTFAFYWLKHLYLLIFPTSFCFDYSMGCIPVITEYEDIRNLSLLTAVVILTLGLAAIYKLLPQSFRRISLLSFFLGILTFLPATNILFTVGFTVAERVLYLPSIGFCLLVSIFMVNLPSKVKFLYPVILTSFVFYGAAGCHKRSSLWNSSFFLYSNDVSVCPNNAKIHYNLAKLLAEKGILDEAEYRYRQAILLEPSYASAMNNLGNLLERKGSMEEAENLFHNAIAVSPLFCTAWMNLGINLMHQQKYNDSKLALEHSIRISPHSANSYFNLGNLFLKIEEKQKAKESWMKAIRLNPSHSSAWNNLFLLLEEINECKKLFSLSPIAFKHVGSLPSIYSQRGLCYAKQKEFAEAEKDFKEAVRISGNSSLYWKNLNILYSHWQPAHLKWNGSNLRETNRINNYTCTIGCR